MRTFKRRMLRLAGVPWPGGKRSKGGTVATNRKSRNRSKHPGEVPKIIAQKGMKWRRENLQFVRL